MLRQAIQSVLDQTYQDFELIVVDDGSTDNTPDVVASFSDPRIRYIRQVNQERSMARNNGVNASNGEFVSFLDSDDVWLPHKLAMQVDLMDRFPDVVLVYGSDVHMDERNHLLTPHDLLNQSDEPVVKNFSDDLLLSCPLTAVSMLMRRTEFDRTGGFDPSLSFSEDWDFWIRVSELGPFCSVQVPVSAVRIHSDQSINNLPALLKGSLAVIEKTRLRRSELDNSNRLEAELFSYAAYAARAAYCKMEIATEWIKVAIERSAELCDDNAVRSAFVGCALADVYSLSDYRTRAGWLKNCVHLVNSLGGHESVRVWSGMFWGAAVHACRGVGDYRTAVRAFVNLVMSGGICHVDRGVFVSAMRSAAALVMSPCSKSVPLPYQIEIETYLSKLRDMSAEHEVPA